MATNRKTLVQISELYEDEEGFDSITTIELKYPKTRSGTFQCIWPGCVFTRQDSHLMWKHVHFSAAHMIDLRVVYGLRPDTLDEVLERYIIA